MAASSWPSDSAYAGKASPAASKKIRTKLCFPALHNPVMLPVHCKGAAAAARGIGVSEDPH